MRRILFLLILTARFAVASDFSTRMAVHSALNQWHSAAAHANEARYFEGMTEDAVFLGSDATERWTRASFREWARPFFARGKAWTLVPRSRNVSFSADRSVAWFDEELYSESYGQCRGSGVAVLGGDGWKVAQYNFSLPIPNALIGDFVKKIRGR